MADTVGKTDFEVVKSSKTRQIRKGNVRKHIITVKVRNEMGVLARIATYGQKGEVLTEKA